MTPSFRTFVGTILLVVLLIVYVFVAMLVAVAVLPTAGAIAQFFYYAVAGLAWVPLAAVIISWMYRKK
jgi:hypothetical protein